MNLENFFISQFEKKHIGDDGAVVGETVYSKDGFFENVHFKKGWLNYAQIAQKAMVVNISDAIAMNAKPCYALLCVAMPKTVTKEEAKELAEGFKKAAKQFNIEIIGGDTICNTKLDITVTIISKVKKPLLRSGLKSGHLLAYTGTLGKSYKELKKLLNFNTVTKYSKFKHIELRQKFVTTTSKYLSCGMDISDGLYSDLEKLSKHNRLGFRFHTNIPKRVGCSGEEYEMLVGFDKRLKKAIIRRAKQTRTPLCIFADAKRKHYTNRCKGNHFG